MKLYISNDGTEIEGFVNINTKNLSEQIKSIADHSCTNIVAKNVADVFSHDSYKEIIRALYDKLRLTGTLSITGVDSNVLCRHFINSYITPEQLSEAISTLDSIHSMEEVESELRKYNDLTIQSKIKGITYELSAIRS